MKILLDENLPRKLVGALRAEGHEVESVITLRMQGLDNGGLYEFAFQNFEVCFTRDFGLINNVRLGKTARKIQIAPRDTGTKTAGRIRQGFHRSISRGGLERIPTWRRLAVNFNQVAHLDFFRRWITMLSFEFDLWN